MVVHDPRSPSRLVCKRVVSGRRRHIVVRGDNPEASTDSRAFGPVPVEWVVGRVLRRYWPSRRPTAARVLRGSDLAGLAHVRGAAGDLQPDDRVAAAAAGLTLAVVDLVLALVVADLSEQVAVLLVGERRPAVLDRL